jgi:hypothetical protein
MSRAPQGRAAFTLSWGAASLLSCTELVSLGTECPTNESSCAVLTEPDVVLGVPSIPTESAGPQPLLDAGLDSSVDSAAPATQQMSVLPDASFVSLVLQNPSFERHGGVGGDVVLSEAVSTLVPVAPVDTVFADLPSWYACVPLSVSSLTWRTQSDSTSVRSEYGDFLSFVLNGTTVRQQLGVPLEAGRSYSFEAQVMGLGVSPQSARLEVQGASSVCGAGEVLGRSAWIAPSTAWTRTCVTFMADEPYPYLLLAPGIEGAAPGGNPRVYLDELRQVASCDGPR